jgi:hypothetical protein
MFPIKAPNNIQDLLGLLGQKGAPGSPLEFLQIVVSAVEAGDYICRKLDQYEKDQRFDDNTKKLVVQATRLFESGQISKAQLKAMIDQLPETVEVKPEPQVDLNEMLKDVDPNKLAQLLKMIQ